MLCIMEPKDIDSMLMPAQVKQPLPKYFWITALASGLILMTSPMMVSFVTFFFSAIIVASLCSLIVDSTLADSSCKRYDLRHSHVFLRSMRHIIARRRGMLYTWTIILPQEVHRY